MGLFGNQKGASDEYQRKAARGIAEATGEGLRALIEHFELPQKETLKVFGIAYASALAKDVGRTVEDMYGDEVAKFEKMMDS